jgi:DNA-binding IclR family transcriptional regulator
MDINKYKDSAHIARAFAIVRVLGGHTVKGLAPGEIAKAIDEPNQANVTRMLANLNKLGVVEETRQPGRWRCGPAFIQIALAYQLDMQRAIEELDEIKQRYSRR